MWRIFILLSLIPFLTESCLLLSDSNETPKETLTDKAQKTILNYNSKQFQNTFNYEAYYFSKLIQHRPPEIASLQQLFDEKDALPSKRREMSRGEYEKKDAELDSLIDVKKYEIKRNAIHSTYSMEHIFLLSQGEPENENYQERVVEAEYFMNHKLDSIIDVEAGMNASIPRELSGAFETFFFEDPLHRSEDYNADRNSDESFYLFFKERLSQLYDVNQKSDFLLHALYVTKLTQKNQKYVPEQFGLLLANQMITDTYGDSYKETLRTSKMRGLYDEDDQLLGYEIFIEAAFKETVRDTICFYFNYNPWLEIVKFEIVEPPYEDFLN